MGILFGLAAALAWGTADFCARFSTRLIGTFSTLFLMQTIGFAALGTYLLASGEAARHLAASVPGDWAWALSVGLLNLVSSFMLYRAFEIGVISMVAPIAASYAAVTVILALLGGETLSAQRGAGVLVTLLGVVLAAVPRWSWSAFVARQRAGSAARGRRLPPGLLEAVGAALAFGVTFWILGVKVTPVLGGVIPVFVSRTTTLVVLGLAALLTSQPVRLPATRSGWLFLVGVGVLDTVAFVSNAVGLLTDQVAVVTLLGSLFSAVTVVLAWVFLHERLVSTQWLGILVIFAGIVLVSI